MSWPKRIALVGFMGSGKTTVGRILAERMGYRLVDSDQAIELRAQATVSEIFRLRGEAWFREIEQQTIRDLLKADGCVIATGGGAFAEPACAGDLLALAFTIHLRCDFEEAWGRVAASGGRPLVEKGETAARALFADRKDKYSRAHATVDTTRRSPDEVAAEVLRLLPQDQ